MPSCVSTNVSGRKYETVWVELREKKNGSVQNQKLLGIKKGIDQNFIDYRYAGKREENWHFY